MPETKRRTHIKNRGHEGVLTIIGFLVGATPIFMLLGGGMAAMRSMGMSLTDVMNKPPDPAMHEPMMKAIHHFMSAYLPFVLLPAMIVLAVIWVRARRVYPRLANRIGAGLAAGFVATFGLTGVAIGAFPGDMPTMFGQMITGRMSQDASVLVVGYLYHFLNGATFGLMFTLLAGKVPWPWGVAWGLFFELGMMTLPPVPMMAGPFGIHGFWPKLFIVSLVAHVVFGAILGLLAARWVRDRGTLFRVLSERRPVDVSAPLGPTANAT